MNKVYLKIRRFDLSINPKCELMEIELDSTLQYNSLKNTIASLFNIKENDRVIKIRNKDNILLPMITLLEGNTPNDPFIVEITKIRQQPAATNPNLQDAYIDTVRQKLSNVDSRVTEAELLMPEIQLQRQNHMDETLQTLSSRLTFLNKRIDELMPTQWKAKMPSVLN